MSALTPLTAGAPVTYRVEGKGATDPVAANTLPDGSDDPAGRALNRRVTISYAVTEPTAPVPLAGGPLPSAPPPSRETTVEYHPKTVVQTSHYKVTVDGISRSGSFVVLQVRITCTGVTRSDPGTNPSCDGQTDFAGSNTAPPLPFGQAGVNEVGLNTLSAIYLSDPGAGEDYAVAHDVDGRPLTASVNPSIRVNDTYPLWLYFPAPAPTVGSLSVILPGGAARVDQVPITP